MSNTSHIYIKRWPCSSLLRVAVVLAICSLFTLSPVFAQNYDVSDFPVQPLYQGQSAGTGVGQNGTAGNIGYRSVPLSEFEKYTNADNTSYPVVESPITQNNYAQIKNGPRQDIYSYSSAQIKPQEWDPTTSGTSGTQTPQLQPGQSPAFLGQRGSLPPTSMNLQANFTAGANTEIPQWKKANYGFNTVGGLIGNTRAYQGLNYNNSPLNFSPTGPAGSLPPTSLGSVNLNIVNNTHQEQKAALNGTYVP